MLTSPASRVKNSPGFSLASNGSISATPAAARAQRVRLPEAAAVLGLSRWISTSRVLNVWLIPRKPMRNWKIKGTATCCVGISVALRSKSGNGCVTYDFLLESPSIRYYRRSSQQNDDF